MNWNAVIAICTASAAVFTAIMAWYTRAAINNSHQEFRDAQSQSETHHRDTFRPIVVLSPFEGVEPENRSTVIQFDPAVGSGEGRFVRVSGFLRNVGVGPALRVRLHFRATGKSGYGFTLALTPIGAGEKYDLGSRQVGPTATQGIRYPVHLTEGFNSTDITFASGTDWELVLEYEDVFGNAFHTIHRKNPQMPWTECGKGLTPSTPHRDTKLG